MKYHPNGSVLFVTFTVEEGLLLLSNPLCKAIIKSCLAAAQNLYPVRISHLLVEASHMHMVITVYNPEHVPSFMTHLKTESAHMINSLLGRKKRTLWCEGYDSPTVLTFAKAMMVTAYIYSNPAKDNLVRSIDDYPGLSSWQMFKSGECLKVWKRLRRPQFRALPKDSHNLRGYTKEAGRLLADSAESQTFLLEPNAWLEAFGITGQAEQQRINARVIERVRTLEERAARVHKRDKKSIIGRERLTTQRIDLTYRPRRKGKRMWCLAERRAIRMAYIRMFKKSKKEARRVLALWRQGDMTGRYPPGLYPLSFPKLANALVF
jgi:REP element-mobilizing transposase RayT